MGVSSRETHYKGPDWRTLHDSSVTCLLFTLLPVEIITR